MKWEIELYDNTFRPVWIFKIYAPRKASKDEGKYLLACRPICLFISLPAYVHKHTLGVCTLYAYSFSSCSSTTAVRSAIFNHQRECNSIVSAFIYEEC